MGLWRYDKTSKQYGGIINEFIEEPQWISCIYNEWSLRLNSFFTDA